MMAPDAWWSSGGLSYRMMFGLAWPGTPVEEDCFEPQNRGETTQVGHQYSDLLLFFSRSPNFYPLQDCSKLGNNSARMR